MGRDTTVGPVTRASRHIGILATGAPSEEHTRTFGSYADMFVALLNRVAPEFSFEIYDAADGRLPRFQTPTRANRTPTCDGFIITGSKHGVYERLPWMAPMESFIRAAYQADTPLVGICFGHQIVASAFGGVVEQYAGGWGVGVHRYDIRSRPAFFDPDEGDTLTLNAIHQDQVTAAPEGATLLVTSEFCRFGGFLFGNRILTLQGHPEFQPDYERALLETHRGGKIPSPGADAALETLGTPVENARVARWIARFLARVY